MVIIGFIGKKGSGKTSTADIALKHFEENLGLKAVHINFADPLKDEVFEFLKGHGVQRSDLDHPEKKKRFRLLMQWWGTEFKRYEDDDYWVSRMRVRIEEEIEKGTDVFLCSDLRFLNEEQLIRSFPHSTIVRVFNPLVVSSDDIHSSELEMNKITRDYDIYNDPSQENSWAKLKYNTEKIIETILDKHKVKVKMSEKLKYNYGDEIQRTASKKFHNEHGQVQAAIELINEIMVLVHDLDLLKKAIYYGKPIDELEFEHCDLETGLLDGSYNYDEEWLSDLMESSESQQLLHTAIGLFGEAGEFLDAVAGNIESQGTLDHINGVEELGDSEYYLEWARQLLDVSRDKVLDANVRKLRARYKTGFSSQEALTRDLSVERKKLEDAG